MDRPPVRMGTLEYHGTRTSSCCLGPTGSLPKGYSKSHQKVGMAGGQSPSDAAVGQCRVNIPWPSQRCFRKTFFGWLFPSDLSFPLLSLRGGTDRFTNSRWNRRRTAQSQVVNDCTSRIGPDGRNRRRERHYQKLRLLVCQRGLV